MSDANNPNIPPSQFDASADRNWQENEDNFSEDATLEEKLFWAIDPSDLPKRDRQNNEGNSLSEEELEDTEFEVSGLEDNEFFEDTDFEVSGLEDNEEVKPLYSTVEEQLFSLLTTIDNLDEETSKESPLEQTDVTETTEASNPLETALADLDRSLLQKAFYEGDRDTNWFEIAHQLEEQNQKLDRTIFLLKQTLEESQANLKQQLERSLVTENTALQQAEELLQTQDQLINVANELETSQLKLQRQQTTIQKLTQQLEFSQQQVTRLEQEYSLLQENCDDKSQKLVSMEKHLSELWSRLHRQQRYTLEYKTALEEFLKTSATPRQRERLSQFPMITSSIDSETAIEPWSTVSQQKESDLSSSERRTNLSESDNSDRPFESDFEDYLEDPSILEVDIAEVLETSETRIVAVPRENWPSPLITTTRKSQMEIKVDLPGFLRTRHSD
jgi:chromosome segregation ATPase